MALGHQGRVYKLNEGIVFSSVHTLRNLALYGPVGASGVMEVTVSGEMIQSRLPGTGRVGQVITRPTLWPPT